MPGHTRLVVVMSPVHGGEEEVRGGVMVTEAVELRGEEEEQGRRRRRRGRRSISSWSNRKCRSGKVQSQRSIGASASLRKPLAPNSAEWWQVTFYWF